MQHWRISILGAALASAGLPIYIQFPHFAQTELGISLGVLGLVLPLLRLIDMGQDPILGMIAARYRRFNYVLMTIALAGIAVGNVMLFVYPLKSAALGWSSFWLVVVFSSYSLGIILVYAQTPIWAHSTALADQTRVGSFREIGMLIGVIILGLTPTVAAAIGLEQTRYGAIGWVVAALALSAWILGRPLWRASTPSTSFQAWPGALLRDQKIRPMLILGFVNAMPVAITSTLFVFFVEDALALTDLSGPYLILFFLSSGIAIPFWAKAVRRYPLRRVLSLAMGLAIVALLGALLLAPGQAWGYGVMCVITGAAIGADLVLLPTAFSMVLARSGQDPAQGFGLWSFASKAALVCAVLAVLPLLDFAGFHSGQENSETALWALRMLYAGIPAALKCIAIWLLWRLPADVINTKAS